MIEKRVINGKTYWVDVIINPDGSRVETVFGNPMQDLADTQARAMEEVLEAQRKKNQEEFDRQQRAMVNAQLEEETRLRKQREDLEREVAQLKRKKTRLQPDYNPDDYDVMEAEENFTFVATREEYLCYYYMKTHLNYDVCPRKALNEMMATDEWKEKIYPKLVKEADEEKKKLKEEVKPTPKRVVESRDFKTLKLIIGIVVLIIALFWVVFSIEVFHSYVVGFIGALVGAIIFGLLIKDRFL